ncbi:SLC13 family permease [Gorillibacterium sp. CAU 1737]|uniref:SLC13 family permease n=1 Tax=Gorillibacterium sp. CAU 1737 TaxID=3140362 RepID=UPI003260509E
MTTFSALLKRSVSFCRKEPVFVISFLAAAVAGFCSPPHVEAIHWSVIGTLFSLMLVCLAYEECNVLQAVAGAALSAFATPRKLGLAMIAATGVLAMFVTNDVALLTVVPLTLLMARMSGRDPFLLVILETLAANLFSALTPFGNPQNLFLYAYYSMSPAEFFIIMAPLGAGSIVLLVAANHLLNRGEPYPVQREKTAVRRPLLLTAATAAFVLTLLAVFRVLSVWLAAGVTVLLLAFLAPKLFRRADYLLLGTFVLFFLFTDSLTGIPVVREALVALLGTPKAVLFTSVGLSQIISNVPAAVLLASFTPHYRELLIGVSVGGLGTVVASLASLISYRLYSREYPPGRYLAVFTLINVAFLVPLLLVMAFL